MEERLDARYLSSGPLERATAVGLGALGVGMGILLGAWGLSFLWRSTPPEITVRVANPELRVTQEKPLKIEQDKPFVLAQPKPLQLDLTKPTIMGDHPWNDPDAKTTGGDVIRREVTVFWSTKHGPGDVTTGWNYKDGSGGMPVGQYCYYAVLNGDGSMTKVDIASAGSRLLQISASLVPDLEGALAKCQWWHAEAADPR
jgi:hypothetical protein